MRSVEKGVAPQVFTDYHDARDPLAKNAIGWYCSYCEMPVRNMIEVEHVHPISRGGNEFDWENFLLSCKYCNTVKLARNASRVGYLWPDKDNTILAFEYSEKNIIEPSPVIAGNAVVNASAIATIGLMGLNRTPHSGNEPTDRDSRWQARIAAIGLIKESLSDWKDCSTIQMARQIGRTASGHGFYSFWLEFFKNEPIVLAEIRNAFLGTYHPRFDAANNLVIRAGGTF